jgi:phosphate transport system substrate-binding protein
MKRLIAILLILALPLAAAACGAKPGPAEATGAPTSTPAPTAAPTLTPGPTPVPEPTPTPAPGYDLPPLTAGTMPRLDGSTSTAPLAVAICAAILGQSREEAEGLVQFSKTTNAYMHLLHDEADLLIVGEANQEVLDEKASLGFEWLREPFATDAFVFVVNENNPVESITVEQARRIYTGEITNWRELGGEDRAITALQRNQGAGSQTLMEKLVMQGEPMMEAPEDYIVATMGQLMSAVKSYDGSADAIGYSVYYYAEEMKMAQGLKLLKLEGVEPNPETIRSEEYPLVNPKYVVIPADAAADEPNRILYDWLLSPGGQRMIADEGYVSVMDLTVTPKVTPLIGSRRYEGYTDHLICRDDYGLLIPFAGQRLADDWPADSGCLYGLMTRAGEVVVDPVYSKADAPVRYDAGVPTTFPLLLLRQGTPDGFGVLAVAAADGSWCTGFDYLGCRVNREGLVLPQDGGITLMRPDGSTERVLTREELGLDSDAWERIMGEIYWGDGWFGERMENLFVLRWDVEDGVDKLLLYDLDAGSTVSCTYEAWCAMQERLYPWTEPEETEEPAVENAEPVTDLLLGGAAPYLLRSHRWDSQPSEENYYRADGTALPQFTHYGGRWYQRISLVGGLIEQLELNTATYYDLETLEPVFRTTLNYEAD